MNRTEDDKPPVGGASTPPERPTYDDDELEPTFVTPASRCWDIKLPPDVRAALGLDRL